MEVKLKMECPDCHGSGIYVGMAEKNGCAVVCSTCKGHGFYFITHRTFTERKIRQDIKRVFKTSCGFVHGPDDVTTEDGTVIKFSEGGCKYDEWLSGKEPEPVRDLYCPYLWTHQSLQSNDVNNLFACRCNTGDGVIPGRFVSKCSFWKDKAKCWDIFEGRDVT